MSRKAAHAKKESGNVGVEADALNPILVIRLVIASVVFTVSLIIKLPDLIFMALLIGAAAVAGYDIFFSAFKAIKRGDYFNASVVVSVVAVVSYVIGFYTEGTALMLLYQIGLLLIAYAADHTKKSALELLRYQDEGIASKVAEMLGDKDVGHTRLEYSICSGASLVLKLAMVFAVIYAVAYPLLSGNTYIVSVHRAITMILIATPVSVVVSLPLTAMVGLCYSAQQGVLFNNAASMEKTSEAETFVFDKTGIFTEECPRVLSVNSDVISSDTLLSFAAHAVYYSEQPFAKAITAFYEQEYRLELIEDFSEIPGLGVDLSIGGARVTFGVRELFNVRGIKLPPEELEQNQKYYMTISGRYVGYVALSSDINEEASEIIFEIKQNSHKTCVLLTENGEKSSRQFADELGFDEVFAECDTDKKLKLLKDLGAVKNSSIVFIYSTGIEAHSVADVDIRIGKKGKYADVLVSPEYLANIPFALQVCARVKEISTINAIFAFTIKAILIFISMLGFCNVWFAIFIDMVAACATILNTIRVTKESVLSIIRYKIG